MLPDRFLSLNGLKSKYEKIREIGNESEKRKIEFLDSSPNLSNLKQLTDENKYDIRLKIEFPVM